MVLPNKTFANEDFPTPVAPTIKTLGLGYLISFIRSLKTKTKNECFEFRNDNYVRI